MWATKTSLHAPKPDDDMQDNGRHRSSLRGGKNVRQIYPIVVMWVRGARARTRGSGEGRRRQEGRARPRAGARGRAGRGTGSDPRVQSRQTMTIGLAPQF